MIHSYSTQPELTAPPPCPWYILEILLPSGKVDRGWKVRLTTGRVATANIASFLVITPPFQVLSGVNAGISDIQVFLKENCHDPQKMLGENEQVVSLILFKSPPHDGLYLGQFCVVE